MSEVLKNQEVFNYSATETRNLVLPTACPRCVNDVYSLGNSLHYHVGSIYLQLADASQGEIKKQYEKLALKQLGIKEQIEKLVKFHINELLAYFYNNGGPIMELPLSEQQAKEKQPFYNRVIDSFFSELKSILQTTSTDNTEPAELEKIINYNITELYTNLSKLIQVKEIEQAFNELIEIVEQD